MSVRRALLQAAPLPPDWRPRVLVETRPAPTQGSHPSPAARLWAGPGVCAEGTETQWGRAGRHEAAAGADRRLVH